MMNNEDFIDDLNKIVNKYRTTLTNYLEHLQKEQGTNINQDVESALIDCVQSLSYIENMRR